MSKRLDDDLLKIVNILLSTYRLTSDLTAIVLATKQTNATLKICLASRNIFFDFFCARDNIVPMTLVWDNIINNSLQKLQIAGTFSFSEKKKHTFPIVTDGKET